MKSILIVTTLALGSWPRQGVARLLAKKRKPERERKCEGMNPHTPKGESHLESWSPGGFPNVQRAIVGGNPMDWKKIYTIEKLLKRRCLKWALMTHLDIWNASYGQKKGWESNWPFDSRSLKVKNRPNFLECKWHVTYRWKPLDEGYNFASDLISIKGLHTKL
jgi:hypothetical protein